MSRRLYATLLTLAIFGLIAAQDALSAASPATVDLSAIPPDLSPTVDPNYIVTFDDSSSMSHQYIPDQTANPNQVSFFSATRNLIYYDPNILYEPASLPDGSSMPAADFNAAWFDGVCSNRPASMNYYSDDHIACGQYYSDLRTANLASEFNLAFGGAFGNAAFYAYFAPFGDPNTPAAGAPGGSGAPPRVPQGCAGTADLANDNCYVVVAITTSAQQRNFANWYSYYRYRNLMARTGVSRAMARFGSSIRVAWQTITGAEGGMAGPYDPQYTLLAPGGSNGAHTRATIEPFAGDAGNHCTSLNTTRCDFFNWLYAINTTSPYTPNRAALIRVGEFLKFGQGANDTTNPFYDGTLQRQLSCRQNFSLLVTDGVWNDANPLSQIPADTESVSHFPDGTAYNPASDPASKIYGHEDARGESDCVLPATSSDPHIGKCLPTLADIAFYYWHTDLRPDLTNNVPAYFPDLTTGITGSVAYDTSSSPAANHEIYFNPANDPATWQHVVTYIVGLGVPGVPGLAVPRTVTNWDLLGTDPVALRRGTKSWPSPKPDDPSGLDDTWHAAVNGRGAFFSARNPQDLSVALSSALDGAFQRTSTSTSVAVSSSVAIAGTDAFAAGYHSTDWSGYLYAEAIDPATLTVQSPLRTDWDAGCKLTGGTCGSAPDPLAGRTIVTKSFQAPGPTAVRGFGTPFQWSRLSAAQQQALNQEPASGNDDGYGQLRLQFLRGVRTHEAQPPLFHERSSVLGAIVNSQPVYVSYPNSGYSDTYPNSSPEALAAAQGNSFERFAYNNRARTPMVYVGANDGMLHAFDAGNGREVWAFVPATVFPKLNNLTRTAPFSYTSYVDNTPAVSDVFFGGSWHTILVGTLRLGGRGAFALDVTNPNVANEGDASGRVMWEFSDVTDPSETQNLGYTFGTPAIGRVRALGGRWVVLIPGGYFCATITTGSNPPNVSESAGSRCPDTTAPTGAANASSLFVLDAESGQLLQEIRVPASSQSYGLASVVLGDYAGDQIADFAVAGDMQGNLWRFDLSDENPSAWNASVDLIFQPDNPGKQPITARPRLFPDPVTHRLTVVVGTGRYLGLSDRTNIIPQQAYYGIREVGPSSAASYPANYYPLHAADLTQQTLTVNPSGTRSITAYSVPASGPGSGGWYFTLPATGERAVVAAGADFSSNRAILVSLTPGGDDPCSPSRQGALMIVDGSSGGPPTGLGNHSAIEGFAPGTIGVLVGNPPISGELALTGGIGGGHLALTGLQIIGDPHGGGPVIAGAPTTSASSWRRVSWRELF